MTLNPAVTQVADGRRRAVRSIVMGSLASIPCQVWRKVLIPSQPATPTGTGFGWSDVATSEADAPKYDYEVVGYAYMLIDRFVGAAVLENNSMTDSGEAAFMAQIEPYDPDITNDRERVTTIPAWQPQKGDAFALLISAEFVSWAEVVGIDGVSLLPDTGKRYTLNKLDNIDHLEPLRAEYDARSEVD